MASITKRTDSPYWRAQIRRQGYEPISRTFDTKAQAEVWARSVENEMDRGAYFDRTESERTTLADALERYRREIVPEKRHPAQEHQRINRWLDCTLTKRSLANLRGADFAAYRDARRDAGRAENTIRLELALISHVFEVARREWGMEALTNPLNNIRKPSGSKARDRRLLPGEFDLLHTVLKNSGNPWAAPAMVLAVETALRQAMLFQLRWSWVNFETSMINIPAEHRGSGNKGVPAVLPMSSRVIALLNVLPRSTDGPVLATTQNAVVVAFKKAKAAYFAKCRSSGEEPAFLVDLTWHDLRHEGATRLFERGLHPFQVAAITGHRSMQTLKRYTHLNPQDFIDKLG